uniref:Uncharacterized protein LOC111103949 isoform X1 n=2 Tax=Crassostrea virginica TaxID=6565 RepID=A0A8B8AP54_CRAVI|nr:uncharacterized protein LOC111103949 isoform X1 [Crassostrea virginica]
MSASKSWAQEVLTCDLCDNPIQQFCNNCQVNLCVECVSKHVDKFQSLSHDIVHFRNRKIQLVCPECKIHSGQRCEVFCHDCQTPVCVMCCIGPHQGHHAVELNKIIAQKKQEIQKETEEIESKLIPKYQEADTNIKIEISKATTHYAKLEKEQECQRKLWHQEVDSIFDTFDTMIHTMKDSDLNVLTTRHAKLENTIQNMTQTVRQNKEILNSKKPEEVTRFSSKLKELKDFPTNITFKTPNLNTNTIKGKELNIELGDMTATLTLPAMRKSPDQITTSSKESFDKAKIVASFPTECRPLGKITCFGSEDAWICGENQEITRIDIHGYVQDVVRTTCKYWPAGIMVTKQNDLVYSDSLRRTVNIVKHGGTETIINAPRGWKPYRLFCTRSGDILVNMFIQGKNKILRYQGHKIIQEIVKDERGTPIFKRGPFRLFMTENKNGDVCVSDVNGNNVVAVDRTGHIQFTYDGKPSGKNNSFGPRCLVTDSLSHLIVADFNNDCLHILDQNGHFLRCLDTFGLENPNGLSVDSEGRLWVGLLNAGIIRVIQYL